MTFNSRKGANVINADLWRILNDCENFRVLWPHYKWRFYCFVTHILEILLFSMDESNLRGMEFQSLIFFAGGSFEAGSASLDFCLWDLCFSLVSLLWESCYSLVSC